MTKRARDPELTGRSNAVRDRDMATTSVGKRTLTETMPGHGASVGPSARPLACSAAPAPAMKRGGAEASPHASIYDT